MDRFDIDKKLLQRCEAIIHSWVKFIHSLGYAEFDSQLYKSLVMHMIEIYKDGKTDIESDVDSQIDKIMETIQNFHILNDSKLDEDIMKSIRFELELFKKQHFQVATLGSALCFGEAALLNKHCTRMAAIKCTKDCYFGTLDKESFKITIARI